MERREFIRVTAGVGAGLTLAVMLDGCGPEARPAAPADAFAPDAWIRIGPDGIVTVMIGRSEMGQGITTALPMLVAEELDADWALVRYQLSPANEAYFNPVMKMQVTGGSTSVRGSWQPLRQAGAAARQMLIGAAAKGWGVPASECATEPGVVVHAGTGKRAPYGTLVHQAALEAVPVAVPLKDPTTFRLIGTPVARLDLGEKVTGRAVFGIDAGPKDALVAVVARCPVFGGRLLSHDPAKALAVPGVRQVFPIESGVAVVADNTWAAIKGRQALEIRWDEGMASTLDDAAIDRELERLTSIDGRVAFRSPGPEPAGAPAKTVEAVFQVPFLAHATMEPMNGTAQVEADRVTIWAPTQFQAAPGYLAGGGARGVAASIAGVSVRRSEVHTTHLGGGFGRRADLDFVREAVAIGKQVKGAVRLVWTREDDVRHDQYRPAARHVVSADLDAAGAVVAWRHRIACQSIIAKFIPGFVPEWAARLAGPLKGGIDPSAVEGVVDLPYAVGHREVRYSQAKFPVPVGYWRSVGHSHSAFAVECFIDELAGAAGQDPVQFRRSLLGGAPRHLAVLELAASKAGWGEPLPAGRFRGIALHESFGSYVAQVAEISVEAPARLRVHRVVCAIDCGIVVNPDTVRAQMESGIVFGLSAALTGKVTIERGRVKESNFHDYPVLRMSEMPAIEVHIVPSSAALGGAGEPGTPPIAAAVANAVFAATGRRVRSLPIRPA